MQAPPASFRAWGRTWVVTVLLAALASSAAEGTWLSVAVDGGIATGTEVPPQAPRVVVDWHDDTGLEVTVDVAGLELAHRETGAGSFVWVSWPDATLGGEIGAPALPVVRRLFVAPPGATVSVDVVEGVAAVINPAELGFSDPVIPLQAPIPMIPGALEQAAYDYDQAAYAADELLPEQRVRITELGVARGHRLHLLEVWPVACNPAVGTLTVWQHIRACIRFEGGGSAGGPKNLPPLTGVLLNPPPASSGGREGGNYLIIIADAYAGSAPITQFASAKTAAGYNVTTHPVSTGTSNTDIKAYIQSLWGTPDAPDYVLLVGDNDSIPCWIGQGDDAANTDLPYVCMDAGDDWYPDIPIGRFSVRSQTDLQRAVDKSLFVAAGDYPDPSYVKRAAFLAGTDAESGDEATHDWVIDTYLNDAGFNSQKLYMRTYGANTQDVRDAFNGGCLYGVFYGHSWSNQWQNGPAFSNHDVEQLNNSGMYGILLNFTCVVGDFAGVYRVFAETWQREDHAAAAVYGASGYIYYANNPGWPETSNLQKFFFDSIYLDGIRQVSPAWQAALYRLLAEYGPTDPACRDYFEMFNLLGDPSLPIPRPQGFDLFPDPQSQCLCSPPANEAVYTIEVEAYLGFNELVTLVATGQPAGSSVSFSVNSLPPPFTTTMTVSDITGGSPGEYAIEITGYATTMTRSTTVELNLASGVPDTVTLASPPDGATGVPLAPTLTWLPASQAVDYDLEVATDAGFSNIVYSATTSDTFHTLESNLNPLTQHYWHVQASNACGDGGFSPAFTFTTVDHPSYFTEQFIGDFDLSYFNGSFIPDGSGDYYYHCGEPLAALPTDPAGGTVIPLGDDRYEQIYLDFSRTVELYGLGYTNFYVCSNGYITFTSGDTDWDESLEDHFDLPRISALFHDLDPDEGGTISWMQLDNRAVVTYEDVPEQGTSNTNTFQVEMYFDGKIRIAWLGVGCTDAIVGLSAGYGVPGDYLESDLSAVERCCPGDLNGDGVINLGDLSTLLSNYGTTSGATYEQGDINGDGAVSLADLSALLSVYGTTCN